MIVKSFEKSLDLLQEEALNRRIHPHHPRRNEIATRFRQSLAGYLGEKEVFYYLTLLPKKKYRIFHNLRLRLDHNYFQVDFLILTSKYILILEVKNYQGTVLFKEFDQLVQVKESGKEEVFPNPISQVFRHKFLLQRWFDQIGFPIIPMASLVAFTSATRIENQALSPELSKHIITSPNLLLKLESFDSHYQSKVLNERQLNQLCKILLDNHHPMQRDILRNYQLDVSDLFKGVLCPHCSYTVMKYNYLNWICPKCGFKSSDAHIEALNDYFLLINEAITIKDGLDYLKISSRKTVKKLLDKAGYKAIGQTRNRKYLLELKQ